MPVPCVLGLATALALTLGTAACTEPPVRWRESAAVPPAPTPETRLALDAAGGIEWLPPEPAPLTVPAGSAACPGSLRIARAGAQDVYAVWWQPRPDSSAALLAARSPDGGRTWPDVAPVDTADRGANGCRRPAAAVAADAATGYVHVTYALVAPGGTPGVFFAHSPPGHFMFHAPVPIVYGERPGRSSVAASGDVVAVAYEDPNAADPRVGLAISRTLGHTFEHRVPASTGIGAAVEPRVAVAGATVAVAWRQRRSARGLVGDPPATSGAMMVRLGELSGS
ncbi:MAG: hypothetical protein ABR499_11950 [Gemmatimonadaceae bacterium]